MIIVYRRNASNGARDLADALDALRYRGNRLPIERKAQPGDIVIAWGETVPPIPGVQVLNGANIQSKFADAEALAAAGVPTVEVSRDQPVAQPVAIADPAVSLWTRAQELAEEFCNMAADNPIVRTRPIIQGINQLTIAMQEINTAIQRPVPVAVPANIGTWVGRMNNHVGGTDLLTPPARPDYYTKKVELVDEFRIHSFMGRSIRAGKKVPMVTDSNGRPVVTHPWIRSWDGGWKIVYDGISARQAHRNAAHRAVEALGLQFGAVDVGVKADGSVIVLEVNRAPGLSEGSAAIYATAIRRWMAGDLQAAA